MDRRLALVLTLYFLASLVGIVWFHPLEWDEGAFLQMASVIRGDAPEQMAPGDNISDEFHRPVFFSFLISLAWRLTGESVEVARFIALLFSLAGLWFFYRIALKEFGKDAHLLTALLAGYPLFFFWGFHVHTDVPAVALVLASVYFYRTERHFLSGLAIALAFIMRFPLGFVWPGLGLAYLLEKRKHIPWHALGGLTGLMVLFAYSSLYYGGPLNHALLYLQKVSAFSHVSPFSGLLQNAVFGLVSLSFLLPFVLMSWKKSPLIEKSIAVVYSASVLVFFSSPYDRYWLPLIPLALLMARRANSKYFYAAALLSIVISSQGVLWWSDLQLRCYPAFEKAVLSVKGTTDPVVVGDNWAVAGFLLKVPVYPPSRPYTELVNDYHVRHAIMPEYKYYTPPWLAGKEPVPGMLASSFESDCGVIKVYDLNA